MALEAIDRGVNGAIVRAVISNGSVALDGRLTPNDLITALNGESVRNYSQSQLRLLLRRIDLISGRDIACARLLHFGLILVQVTQIA